MECAERYEPWAAVAGASEGVGASVARLLGERGVNVVLVARNQEKLDEVDATIAVETRTLALGLSPAAELGSTRVPTPAAIRCHDWPIDTMPQPNPQR
jgi:short-subunit dehydrogenase